MPTPPSPNHWTRSPARSRRGSFWRVVLGVLLAGAGLAGGGLRAQPATVEGVVVLRPVKVVALSPDRYGLKAGAVTNAPAPVAVVYLEGEFPGGGPTNKVVLGQRGFQFSASVLPVRKGTLVEFPNHDDDYHNVFSYSKTKRFDLGRYRKDEQPAAVAFDQAGPVKLYCEIHEHMRATILVLDTPHFVATQPDGTFRLTGLPAGRYTLKAWVEEKDVRSAPVELTAGGTVRVEFPKP